MSNGNATYRYTPRFKTPAGGGVVAIKHIGFTDYMCGNGFCSDYDTWDKITQVNYEMGRKFAALMSRYVDGPVKWQKNRKLSSVRKAAIPQAMWGEYKDLWRGEQEISADAEKAVAESA